MKHSLFKATNYFFTLLPIDFYISITNQKNILPFYHSITSNPKPHLKHLGYFRSNEDFKNDILFLKSNYKSVELQQLDLKNKAKKQFHISFDDGLSEVYTNALPLILEHKIHATLFINSDFVDNKTLFYRHKVSVILDAISNSEIEKSKIASFLYCENLQVYQKINQLKNTSQIEEIAKLLNIDFDLYLLDYQPYLTSKQILELQKAGFKIGNHSKNHPNFKDISYEEQKSQIVDSFAFLKSNFDVQKHYFSFPFGDENIKNELFNFMYTNQNIIQSFGISGLKKDEHLQHLHRIPMEYTGVNAEQIIKFEYFYFIMKSFLGKNKVKR